MNQLSKKVLSLLSLFALAAMVLNDVYPHFDRSLIDLKRKNRSPQRDWNLFFGQKYVYLDSSFRYQKDLDIIDKLIEPNSLFLSDVSTSYYIAAQLPAYVKNIHRHHGRAYDKAWDALLSNRTACYLQDPKNIDTLITFLERQNRVSEDKELPQARYIVVNKDRQNINLRQDCLWLTRERLIQHVELISTKLYDGEKLNLYEVL